MVLKFSDSEITVIKVWAENNIHGGHWGNGDFYIPEEKIILQKLDNVKKGKIEINEYEAGIILKWSESLRGVYTMEDESAINKIKEAIKQDD
jgi:hypothetical protein